jgi:hypothetical protein
MATDAPGNEGPFRALRIVAALRRQTERSADEDRPPEVVTSGLAILRRPPPAYG